MRTNLLESSSIDNHGQISSTSGLDEAIARSAQLLGPEGGGSYSRLRRKQDRARCTRCGMAVLGDRSDRSTRVGHATKETRRRKEWISGRVTTSRIDNVGEGDAGDGFVGLGVGVPTSRLTEDTVAL
jgi:ribosomal protein L34E